MGKQKYAPIVQERDAYQTQLHNELIGGGFARSKFIQENVSVPADMIQAQFGKNFKIEDGKVVAVGADGQKIFSRALCCLKLYPKIAIYLGITFRINGTSIRFVLRMYSTSVIVICFTIPTP